jgi:two-component system chemotaxis response regulator CheB
MMTGGAGGERHGAYRVLIVDDSATMRRLIRATIAGDPRLTVVGEAGDPHEARERIKALSPDVLTLDVEMPHMNGIEFLSRLMRLRPMPVVMLSTLTHQGSQAAIEALALGAIDCIGKPTDLGVTGVIPGLCETLFAAAGAHPRAVPAMPPGRSPVPAVRGPVLSPGSARPWSGPIILVGSSTGGVEALEHVLSGMPADCPPILITQHMPALFLTSFAQRLDGRVAPRVALAGDGAALLQGQVLIAPGGDAHLELSRGRSPVTRLVPGELCSGHRPSVDRLMASAVDHAARIVAVMLTGMGRDGAEGMAALRARGAHCIAQDQATSVVWGMPRAAIERGGADQVLPLERIAAEVLRVASQGTRQGAGQRGGPARAPDAGAGDTSGAVARLGLRTGRAVADARPGSGARGQDDAPPYGPPR